MSLREVIELWFRPSPTDENLGQACEDCWTYGSLHVIANTPAPPKERNPYQIFPAISEALKENNRSKLMHPILLHVVIYLLQAQRITNSQQTDRQTVLVLEYDDYRYIYSQNERTCSSNPISNLVVAEWPRRLWHCSSAI